MWVMTWLKTMGSSEAHQKILPLLKVMIMEHLNSWDSYSRMVQKSQTTTWGGWVPVM